MAGSWTPALWTWIHLAMSANSHYYCNKHHSTGVVIISCCHHQHWFLCRNRFKIWAQIQVEVKILNALVVVWKPRVTVREMWYVSTGLLRPRAWGTLLGGQVQAGKKDQKSGKEVWMCRCLHAWLVSPSVFLSNSQLFPVLFSSSKSFFLLLPLCVYLEIFDYFKNDTIIKIIKL